MEIHGANSKTGEKFQADADVDESFVQSMMRFDVSDEQIARLIDNLAVSADIKSLLYDFSKATIQAGSFIIKIGRKIIDFVSLLLKEYPHATFGLIFGAIATFLISSIPIIGVVLGTVVTSIMMVTGWVNDIQDNKLRRKISEINAEFSQLNV